MKPALQGLRVLVTRPQSQATGLINALTQAGATAISYPVLEIVASEYRAVDLAALSQFEQYEAVIFISTNAVRFAADTMQQNGLPVTETRSQAIQLLAIGQATSRQIEQSFGTTGAFPTTAADSESLLALASLQEDKISGKTILIVRGEGGRETLKQQLEQRGATVQYLELYRRVSPQFDPINPNPLPSLLQDNGIDIVTITSGQALEYLIELAEDKPAQLKRLPLLAPSQRIVDIAKRSGFEKLIQSRGARDMDIVDALIQWQQSGSTL